MNANNYQLAGLSYIQKLRTEDWQEEGSRDPFAIYDALTPDEPIWAVQIARRGLKAAEKSLASLRHTRPAVRGLSIDPSLAD